MDRYFNTITRRISPKRPSPPKGARGLNKSLCLGRGTKYLGGKDMERTTKKQVESKVEYLNKVYDLNLNIGYAYGGARIESNNGSMDISCRGTKSEIYWQLRAIEEVLRIKNNYYTQDSYHQVKPL